MEKTSRRGVFFQLAEGSANGFQTAALSLSKL